jgi:hypothetical protein
MLGQMLNISFLGSVYSLPRIQKSMGYQQVQALR